MTAETLAAIGTIVTYATFVAKCIFDERNRRIDIEEKKALAGNLAENTKISQTAFDVGNHANEKIAATHEATTVAVEALTLEVAKLRLDAKQTRDLVQQLHDN